MASTTPNKDRILAALETMRQGDTLRGEKFQALAYAKAMKGLRALPGEIRTVEDVSAVPGVGTKIRAKIAEILTTGSLAAATQTAQELNLDAYGAFMKIHGVGPVKAKELVETRKITTLAELRAKQATVLNAVQQMGLKYYDDLLLRIPRPEMDEHAAILAAVLPPTAKGIVVGSYRRRTPDSGDIDMLLTFENTLTAQQQKEFLAAYVAELTKRGYLQDVLALGAKKCMAVVKLRGRAYARRLDLLITPRAEFAYSILYFTGSDAFNIAFRKHALTRGYTLNEHTATPTNPRLPFPPPMTNEQEIFTFFGLQYVEPPLRRGEADVRPIAAAAAAEVAGEMWRGIEL